VTRRCDGYLRRSLSETMIRIHELVDLTIDFLHDSPVTLKRCSLVSRSWLPASRYHLFSYLALHDAEDVQRFIGIAKEAPHLLTFLTHLALAPPQRMSDQIYSSLLNISVPNLRQLTIYTLPTIESLPVLQSLVALPSITQVSVLKTQDPRSLFSFFLQRTARLQTLVIGPRHYRGDGQGTWHSSNHVRARPIQRFQLECLYVSMPTTVMAEEFDDPSMSPFDMTALKRLVVSDEYAHIQPLGPNLQKIGSSLTELELDGPIGSFKYHHLGSTAE
jgi:hypothetical protein